MHHSSYLSLSRYFEVGLDGEFLQLLPRGISIVPSSVLLESVQSSVRLVRDTVPQISVTSVALSNPKAMYSRVQSLYVKSPMPFKFTDEELRGRIRAVGEWIRAQITIGAFGSCVCDCVCRVALRAVQVHIGVFV